jgi:hypothetical protein
MMCIFFNSDVKTVTVPDLIADESTYDRSVDTLVLYAKIVYIQCANKVTEKYGTIAKAKVKKGQASYDVKMNVYSFFFLARCLISNLPYVVFVSQSKVNELFNVPSEHWEGQTVALVDPEFTCHWLNLPVFKVGTMLFPLNYDSIRANLKVATSKTNKVVGTKEVLRNVGENGFCVFFAEDVDIDIFCAEVKPCCQNSG